MKVKCKHSYTLMKGKEGFIIAQYRASSPVILPNGEEATKFNAKGYLLPEYPEIEYELEGEFQPYVKNGFNSFTLSVSTFEEILPTKKESAVFYLSTLQGVGKKTAEKMYDKFGDNIYNILENEPFKLADIRGISKTKAEKISESYAKRKHARLLFQYLSPFGVKDAYIMRLYWRYKDSAVDTIKNNPYVITDVPGIGFRQAEKIARAEKIPLDAPERIKAGIMEVLLQGEVGGQLFTQRTRFPNFVYDRFLQPEVFELLYKPDILNVTGSTYQSRNALYLMTLKLLDIPLSMEDFDRHLLSLHLEKKIFISRNENEKGVYVYRYKTAQSEFKSAKTLISLMQYPTPSVPDVPARVYAGEKLLGIRLSDEQREAVYKAIQYPISVITGGPGTGKTAIQKMIIKVFLGIYPGAAVELLAPTGRAAKRMQESTGYPARTIHSALRLYSTEEGTLARAEEDSPTLPADLIIVDECSMIGTFLLNELVKSIVPGTHVIFVGDVDQLPSIEVGAVLRELIDSNVVPLTRLTKTYRQAGGSPIAVNAARIKTGNTILEYTDDFAVFEEETSEAIADKVKDLFVTLTGKYGYDDVMCLSAFRRKTESGSNALNQSLRSAIRDDIDENTPYIERGGMKIYEGDRIMYTRNTEELTNGDIGTLIKIEKTSDGPLILCDCDEKIVEFDATASTYVELAYATTVHKSQGSECKVVIMVADPAHKIMLHRNLVYTGITRAKEELYIVGSKDAFIDGIRHVETTYRRSRLASLLKIYIEKAEPVQEQLALSV